jgi:large-conductance mechanosensitive channel
MRGCATSRASAVSLATDRMKAMMNAKSAAGYRGLQHTPEFQQATGAMHRPSIRIEIGSMIPLLLNFLTVFFIIAGLVLLWMNLRASRRSRITITQQKHREQTKPDQFQN